MTSSHAFEVPGEAHPRLELAGGAEAPAPARRRWLRIIGWIVFLSALAVPFALHALTQSRRAPAPPETVRVTRGALDARVTATGNLSALVTVQVGSQVSGRILSLSADFNSRVHRGQVIAQLDPLLFKAAAAQARANALSAKANILKAKVARADADRQARRAARLFADRLIAESDYTAAATALGIADAEVEAADAGLAVAQAALAQAEVNLGYTTIVSPVDGVVISRNVDVGQTVAASLQSPTLFVIAEDLTKMQVDTSVAEADIGRLQAGMLARFTVDAYPTDVFTGVIREIRNAPQTIQNVVTYDAVIDVKNPDLRLRPGMTASVIVIYAHRDAALLIPNASLRFRPPADWLAGAPVVTRPDERVVWSAVGGDQRPRRAGPPAWRPVARKVQIGVSDGTSTEVLGGDLAEGDVLITELAPSAKSGPGSFGRVF